MAFEELRAVQDRLNNPEIRNKAPQYTKLDLKRTSKVFLSKQAHLQSSEHTQSWWEDYSPLHFDYTRYLLNAERESKTREFQFPQEDLVEKEIFSFFNNNLILKNYVMNEANQHNFGSLARTEVSARIYEAGFISEVPRENRTSLEFRKNPDNSISVFEKFYLPKKIMHIENGETFESDYDSIASVVMRSRITENDGHINHQIESFSIQAIDDKMCKMLFDCPALAELKKYFYDNTGLDLKESVAEDGWILLEDLNELKEIAEENEVRSRQKLK